MDDKKPDVDKLKKKHRVDELVAALRYPDASMRSRAAAALGEIGDRESAANVKALATELATGAKDAGHWDPGEASRVILKAWAVGAAKNADRDLRDYAARLLAHLEAQEAARREALLSGLRQMPPETYEEIPTRPEREAAPRIVAAGMVAAEHAETTPEQRATAARASAMAAVSTEAAATESVAAGSESEATSAKDLTVETDRGAPAALLTLEGHDGEIGAIALTAGGSRAISAAWDGTIRVWDLETGRSLRVLRGHEPGYLAVAVSPDGQRAVSGSADGTVRVWDLESGKNMHTLRDHQGTVCNVIVIHDGREAVSCSSDRTLRLWDVETGRSLRVFEGHEQAVEYLAVPPNGLRAVSGSRDGTVRVWDLESGRPLSKLGGHRGERLLAVAADGGLAVTMDDDGTLRVWDLATEGMTHAYEAGRAVWFSAAAVAPDNSQALLGCWGGGVMMFDLLSGDTLRALEGHTGDVHVIEASPDGSLAVSGSADRTAASWHLPTGRRLGVFQGHTGMVTALTIAQDGSRLVTGSSDATLRVWELPPADDSSATTKSEG